MLNHNQYDSALYQMNAPEWAVINLVSFITCSTFTALVQNLQSLHFFHRKKQKSFFKII